MHLDTFAAPRKPSSPVAMEDGTLSVLILDDSEVDRTRLRRICKQAEFDMVFTEAPDIVSFKEAIESQSFDIIFVDYLLAQGDGLIALEMLSRHENQKDAVSIMVAGQGQIQVAIDAMKRGCSDYIIKENLSVDVMIRAVRNGLEKAHLKSALDTEEKSREAIKATLSKFEANCAQEMRTILSAMLRQSRNMKRQASSGMAPDVSQLSGFETSCSRLWDFLDEFQNFVADTAERASTPMN